MVGSKRERERGGGGERQRKIEWSGKGTRGREIER